MLLCSARDVRIFFAMCKSEKLKQDMVLKKKTMHKFQRNNINKMQSISSISTLSVLNQFRPYIRWWVIGPGLPLQSAIALLLSVAEGFALDEGDVVIVGTGGTCQDAHEVTVIAEVFKEAGHPPEKNPTDLCYCVTPKTWATVIWSHWKKAKWWSKTQGWTKSKV